jgi:Na+/proline symporter
VSSPVLVFQGGLKAVVWSDTLQQIIMMGSSIVVMVLGIIAIGGLNVMWQRNVDGQRIEFFKYVSGQNIKRLCLLNSCTEATAVVPRGLCQLVQIICHKKIEEGKKIWYFFLSFFLHYFSAMVPVYPSVPGKFWDSICSQ